LPFSQKKGAQLDAMADSISDRVCLPQQTRRRVKQPGEENQPKREDHPTLPIFAYRTRLGFNNVHDGGNYRGIHSKSPGHSFIDMNQEVTKTQSIEFIFQFALWHCLVIKYCLFRTAHTTLRTGKCHTPTVRIWSMIGL
jgi:hypothetical protein